MDEEKKERGAPWRLGLAPIVACALALGAALIVPIDWVARAGQLLGAPEIPAASPFGKEAARLDRALEAGERIELGEQRRAVELRRLIALGSVSEPEIVRARAILDDFAQRLAREPAGPGRAALRAERARRLAAALPRLEPERVRRAMERLDRQLDALDAPRSGP